MLRVTFPLVVFERVPFVPITTAWQGTLWYAITCAGMHCQPGEKESLHLFQPTQG